MKNTLRLRNVLFLLFIISLGFLGYKGYLGLEKIAVTKKAEQFYQSEQYAKSEPLYKNAIDNGSILYKDQQNQATYSKLSRTSKEISSFLNIADLAFKNENYVELIMTYTDYLQVKEIKKKDPIFVDFDKHYNTEKQLFSLLTIVQANSYKQMDNNIDKHNFDNENFIFILGKLPIEVYGGATEKSKELTEQFKTYDARKYSFLKESLPFEALKSTINNQLTSYKESGIDAYWLNEDLKTFEKIHESKLAALEERRKKREEEIKKALENEKANDPVFQEKIMTIVNDYAVSWMSAYNALDSSYFVNITPDLLNFFNERFENIRSEDASFIGELLYTEFDLESFKYRNEDGIESVELNVVLIMNSASYLLGEDYELEETLNPWHYKLINTDSGWMISERKEIVDFNYSNTKVFEFIYNN
ncbi:hypothetical protein KDN24_08450 [Bacillus sp. Bva_UNVM-123]|uniref:hypothetical protein n=1 Tax=Bacillus sp. Bva_UNVM-123 TaxID=2829798 RepID=UPI00391F2D67